MNRRVLPVIGMSALALILVVGLALAIPAVRAHVLPGSSSGTPYTNPVLDGDFADPMVLHASDGLYYAYSTQTNSRPASINIQVARSRDLVHWTLLNDALPDKPAWASFTQNFWSPDVVEANGQYIMYFTGQPDATLNNVMCLGVAVATRPGGPFHPMPKPLRCGTGASQDPMAFDDPQTHRHWLFWSQSFQPLAVQELAPDRLHFKPHTQPTELFGPTDRPYERLLQGPFVTYHGGYYYLIWSGWHPIVGSLGQVVDAIMVARAKNVLGPYTKLGDANGTGSSVIVQENSRWTGPGSPAVITDASGQDWIVYDAVDTEVPYVQGTQDTRRALLIDRLTYRNGWAQVQGRTPSTTKQDGPQVH